MKKKKLLFITIKKLLLFGAIFVMMLFLIFCSETATSAANKALRLCACNIIPSLFPFFVLSGILLKTGFAGFIGKFFAPIMKIFGVSGGGAAPFVIGLLCGYPMGAKAICSSYQDGFISRTEAQRLMPFCNNTGVLFVVGSVGVSMLNNAHLGMLLYVIHILSMLFVALSMRFYGKSNTSDFCHRKEVQTLSFSSAFSTAVRDAVFSVLSVCGFIIFFATCSEVIFQMLHIDGKLLIFLKSVIEVANGCSEITSANISLPNALCFLSAILGFGGLCIFMQVCAVTQGTDIGMKTYFFGKTLQGIIAFFLTLLFTSSEKTIAVFAQNVPSSPPTHNYAGMIISIIFILSAVSVIKSTVKDKL